jgi:peptidyl-prolyl cis-trans isomerase D
LHLSLAIYSVVVVLVLHQRWSINGKDISFEDFRIKVSNVEKSTEGITSTAAANRQQEVSVALLTSEFDKLGLRVGEKH